MLPLADGTLRGLNLDLAFDGLDAERGLTSQNEVGRDPEP